MGNYGDNYENKQQDNMFRSMVDNRVSNIAASEASYVNVKNTIASSSSKKTSNNTSCMVSTSSRNASITPRKISHKIKIQGSPDQDHAINERIAKTYIGSTKIQRNKIRPKAVKLSNKHKIVKEKSIRASSGSNRKKFIRDMNDPLNNTGSNFVMNQENYQKFYPLKMSKDDLKSQGISRDELSNNAGMPMVKNRPTTSIYGSMKNKQDKGKKYSSLTKHKEQISYNAHPHNVKPGIAGRNILKAKMEIRTHSDSNDNEYNLLV